MRSFRQFIEANLGFNSLSMQRLMENPLYKESTFGVEIEFAVNNPVTEPGGDCSAECEEICYPWIKKIIKIIKNCEYEVKENNSSNTHFGVGMDGIDRQENLPIIEIRTNPIKIENNELEKFKKLLTSLNYFMQDNYPEVIFENNAGLHIHVSNPAIKNDYF